MFKRDRQLRHALDFSLAHTMDGTAMCAIFGALGSLVETTEDAEALELAQRGVLQLLGGFKPGASKLTITMHTIEPEEESSDG